MVNRINGWMPVPKPKVANFDKNPAQTLLAKLDEKKGDQSRVEAARRLLNPQAADRLIPLLTELETAEMNAVAEIMESLNRVIAEIDRDAKDPIEDGNYGFGMPYSD